MHQIDPELLRVVSEDLEHLQSSWGTGGIKDVSLRIESGMLHRLVCQRDLQTAWNMILAPERLMIECLTMEQTLIGIPKMDVGFASIGGTIRQAGIVVAGAFHVRGRPDTAKLYAAGPPVPIGVTLKKFLSGACMIYHGNDITRSDLINYVRNKLGGGGHFDSKRENATQGFLDHIAKQYSINNQNAVYHEFLAVGQSVASTPATQRLIESIKETLH